VDFQPLAKVGSAAKTMNLAHTFAVAALAISSVTLMGCGGGSQAFKFESFSFESKGTELIIDGKVQDAVSGISDLVGAAGEGLDGDTKISLMFDIDELKFLSSQSMAVQIAQEEKTVAMTNSNTVIIDIKAAQMLIHVAIDMGEIKQSHLVTVPLGDVQSTFSSCLAQEEAAMKVNDKKVKVFSITLPLPNPESPGETVNKDSTMMWQVDSKNVPKEIIVEFDLPKKAKPEDPEDKAFSLVHSTMKVSDKESKGGAPPSEVFQVPEAWGSDSKTTVEKDDPKIPGMQNVMPDAIWKCAGIPKTKVPEPEVGPNGLFVTQLLAMHKQAQSKILGAKAKDEKVVVLV